jgi:phosphate starvation-inducible protein PhoH
VVDEAQNMNYKELKTIITRCGHNSRIVLCGDFKQNDLDRKKNDVSGLGDLLRVLANVKNIGHIEGLPEQEQDMRIFEPVVINYLPRHVLRSGLARAYLLAEEITDI